MGLMDVAANWDQMANTAEEDAKAKPSRKLFWWPAAGSEDTELGVNMEPEVDHGTTEIYTRVQA